MGPLPCLPPNCHRYVDGQGKGTADHFFPLCDWFISEFNVRRFHILSTHSVIPPPPPPPPHPPPPHHHHHRPSLVTSVKSLPLGTEGLVCEKPEVEAKVRAIFSSPSIPGTVEEDQAAMFLRQKYGKKNDYEIDG